MLQLRLVLCFWCSVVTSLTCSLNQSSSRSAESMKTQVGKNASMKLHGERMWLSVKLNFFRHTETGEYKFHVWNDLELVGSTVYRENKDNMTGSTHYSVTLRRVPANIVSVEKSKGISYPECKAHAPYCHLWPARLYSIFPHYPINGSTAFFHIFP
jgi:hypothetical protein